jgi:pimeloyl-ACP methyl ester carboxylesterase
MHPPAPPHGRIGRNKSAGWLSVRIDALLCALDLTGVSLVGHSMGTGEITRYIGKFGTKQLRKAVLIGTLGPYLVKAPDNPERQRVQRDQG